MGRKRVDLLITWKEQRFVIEVKVKRGESYLAQGVKQTVEYMDKSDATEGHLVIFDRDLNKSWDEKIFYKKESVQGKVIDVWEM